MSPPPSSPPSSVSNSSDSSALSTDPTLRQIAEWRVEGLTNVEIAGKLGRAARTVERKLELIRLIWEKIGDERTADPTFAPRMATGMNAGMLTLRFRNLRKSSLKMSGWWSKRKEHQ